MEKRTLLEYLEALNSDKSSPGGGSAAAYVASLSVASVNMALKISIKRKSFLELPFEKQKQAEKAIVYFNESAIELIKYMQLDEKAYGEYLSALKEKDTNIEKYQKECLRIPSELAKKMLELIDEYYKVEEFIVSTIKGDLKMGFFFARAVLQGSLDNISINLKGLKDEKIQKETKDLIEKINRVIPSLD